MSHSTLACWVKSFCLTNRVNSNLSKPNLLAAIAIVFIPLLGWSQAVNLDQTANGPADDPDNPTVWQNGNVNGNVNGQC